MTPILWSFRRCPYAMRARMALDVSGIAVEHREILLRDKPAAFLAASPEATVPVLQTADETLIHSRDIMLWALSRNDPELWLDAPPQAAQLIDEADGPFKSALDRYKYHSRHDDADPLAERARAAQFLATLDALLAPSGWLFTRPSMADFAILPFVRQFAHVDLDWFKAQDWPALIDWLNRFKASERFARIMEKHPLWQDQARQAG